MTSLNSRITLIYKDINLIMFLKHNVRKTLYNHCIYFFILISEPQANLLAEHGEADLLGAKRPISEPQANLLANEVSLFIIFTSKFCTQ